MRTAPVPATPVDRAADQSAKAPAGAPARATLILTIICVSYFMVILDNSIVFTGLPQIQLAMGFSATGLSWITNAYVLVFGGLLLLEHKHSAVIGLRDARRIDDAVLQRVQAQLDMEEVRLAPAVDPE